MTPMNAGSCDFIYKERAMPDINHNSSISLFNSVHTVDIPNVIHEEYSTPM